MKKSLRYIATIAILAITCFVIVNRSDRVYAEEPDSTYITSPLPDETLSGLVTITGAADFEDFLKYEIFLKQEDQMSWAATVYAPVINGILAWIDTRTFLDGTYEIVIRQVKSNSNYTDVVGPSITIENGASPRMYPEIDSSPLYPVEGSSLIRLRNCSGRNLEFDYHSPDAFCSGGDVWLMPKEADADYCPAIDLVLIPCEYRGTAIGMGAQVGSNYEFDFEAGKVYEINFPGGDRLFIAEIEGDERASTDTGGLDRDDPARDQPRPEAPQQEEMSPPVTTADTDSEKTTTEAEEDSAPSTPAEADDDAAEAEQPDNMLPESGQGATSPLPFLSAGVGLVLLMVIGGVMAVRRRSYTP